MGPATPPAADTPRRGRPRSETTRKAILSAASELLLQREMDSISMDAIAEHAAASKATIYRWWPSKELLALDALFSDWEPAGPGTYDTGTLTGDLNALVEPWARQLAAKPYARVIAALITKAQNDPEFAEQYHARFVEPRRDQARAIFARAIEREEIPPDTDIEAGLDLLYGPIYHRILHGHAKLTDDFTRTIVGYVVTGAAQAKRAPRRGTDTRPPRRTTPDPSS
jgi:AcrR family transcriptional regulator